MRPIRRIAADEADINAILQGNEPVILAGEARAWKATLTWTIDGLGKRCPSAPIPVRFTDDTRWWTVGALCQSISRGEHVYGVDWDFRLQHPDLLDELGDSRLSRDDCFNSLPNELRPRLCWLYIGAAGTGSPWHQDVLCTHAWLALFHGRKLWTLMPPDRRDTASGSLDNNAFHGEQHPGDVIFVPSLWWHEVLNLEPTISLTRNFCDIAIRERVYADAQRGRFKSLAPTLSAMWWPETAHVTTSM